jgi:hypothetical protein
LLSFQSFSIFHFSFYHSFAKLIFSRQFFLFCYFGKGKFFRAKIILAGKKFTLQNCFWVTPTEIRTPSGRPPQILNVIYGFESTIPRLTFGVLTRFYTLASSEKSPCQVGQVGVFLNFFADFVPHFMS